MTAARRLAATTLAVAAVALCGCQHNPAEDLGYRLGGPGRSYQQAAPPTRPPVSPPAMPRP